MSALIPPVLLQHLACPRDHSPLREDRDSLCCEHGHNYPVIDGVPVFLLPETHATIGILSESYEAARNRSGSPLYLQTIGVTLGERESIAAASAASNGLVDPVISHLVAATNGNGYLHRRGRLDAYPIPNVQLPKGDGKLMLDIGCNWGRWTVSAARKGWRAVGIDPSLGAIMAAKRAFAKEGLPIWFVCGDARALPFKAETFDCIYSYSVLQHFSRADAALTIQGAQRVLKENGLIKIQMAHSGGFRSKYVMSRQTDDIGVFRVRYWSLSELEECFRSHVGTTRVSAEGFGGLGLLPEDFGMVSTRAKALIAASVTLRALSRVVPQLTKVADSVFVTAEKRSPAGIS